jgi:hypothetical protein
MTTTILMCLSCARELPPRDIREIIVKGRTHGPFCDACAQSAEGIPFDQWLDEQWATQHPH